MNKEGSNPLYKLIDDENKFIKEEFILFERKSLSNTNYYMLTPRNRDRSKISTENGDLTAVDYHITVYEEVKKEVQYSTFHITISLIDKNKKSYVARIYYTEFGTSLFYTIKDEENIPVDISAKNSLLKFAASNIERFVNMLLSLEQDYDNQYRALANELIQKNKELENIDLCLLGAKLLQYKRGLQTIISHIESGTMFNQEHLAALEIYGHLLSETEDKISLIQANTTQSEPIMTQSESEPIGVKSPHPQPVPKILKSSSSTTKSVTKKEPSHAIDNIKIDELNKKIATIPRLKNIGPLDKIFQEYELQNQKLNLLNKTNETKDKKSNQAQSETDLIDTTIRCNQLLDEINKIVLNVLKDEAAYKKIEKQSIRALLQQCHLETENLVELAVNNNRPLVLSLLMQIRNGINLEMKTKDEKQHLLERAYNKGHLEMFQFLLAHKVSPNTVCANKQSILFRACSDGRAKEMEALLEAKANPLAVDDYTGFAPLAGLVMRSNQEQINIPMANVFLTYAPHTIEQLQGRKGVESTPLAYACQQGMWNVVELLLRFGANPNNARYDGATPFGICVYKDNFELFKYVVENSTIPIREGISNALDMAVVCGKQQFVEYIIEYSNEHQLDLSVPKIEEAKKRFEKHKLSPAVVSFGNNITSLFFRSLLSDDSEENDLPLVSAIKK